jgi:molybdenum cofactor cytidylyltransferase
MGKPKQLLPYKNTTLLGLTVDTALASGAAFVVVVLGSETEKSVSILKDRPVQVVINSGWKSGMGSSLKSGLDYIIQNMPQVAGVVVMVCDQPFITAAHLFELPAKSHSSGQPIAATRYANTLGVPAYFDYDLVSDLMKIDDQDGAKKFIQQNLPKTVWVELEAAQIDLDTPEDYSNFMNK